MRWLKPLPLRPGDAVRVVAPSGPFDRSLFEAGLGVLAARYAPRFAEDMASRHRYLAGPDARRARELTDALADDDAGAVFCARGGYGAMRLLPHVDLSAMGRRALVGFSDITALHLALQARGEVSIHGPVLTQLGRQSPEVQARLFQLLESPDAPPPLEGHATYVPGVAEGVLLGGNLAVLTRLLGTPYLPSFKGCVLLLEDVGEKPYMLDRMWTHLRLAGVLQDVAGIALGDFTGCEEKGAEYTSDEVLRALAEETGVPCAAGFPVGHGERNFPVALGTRVRLDAAAARLTFLEGAVDEAAGEPRGRKGAVRA